MDITLLKARYRPALEHHEQAYDVLSCAHRLRAKAHGYVAVVDGAEDVTPFDHSSVVDALHLQVVGPQAQLLLVFGSVLL